MGLCGFRVKAQGVRTKVADAYITERHERAKAFHLKPHWVISGEFELGDQSHAVRIASLQPNSFVLEFDGISFPN